MVMATGYSYSECIMKIKMSRNKQDRYQNASKINNYVYLLISAGGLRGRRDCAGNIDRHPRRFDRVLSDGISGLRGARDRAGGWEHPRRWDRLWGTVLGTAEGAHEFVQGIAEGRPLARDGLIRSKQLGPAGRGKANGLFQLLDTVGDLGQG